MNERNEQNGEMSEAESDEREQEPERSQAEDGDELYRVMLEATPWRE